MTEALASLAGVLIAGGLLGVEVWVVAIGILAWVVSRPGPITTRVSVVAGLLLAVSAVAYVGAAVLIGAMLPSAH
jgi:hypothetical protein